MTRASESATSPRKRFYREGGPGERWWFALFLMPTLLTAAVVYTRGEVIESELEQASLVQLQAAGLTGVTVQMSGRNAVVLVPTGQNEAKAVAAVQAVNGIGDVDSQHVASSAAEARACEGLQDKVDRVVAGGIPFPGGSAALSGSSAGMAEDVAKLLVRCPAAIVSLDGHADGSVLNASTVSLRRAEAVRSALVRAGVKANRLEANGYGASNPASREDTAAGRALNNRVTITVSEQ